MGRAERVHRTSVLHASYGGRKGSDILQKCLQFISDIAKGNAYEENSPVIRIDGLRLMGFDGNCYQICGRHWIYYETDSSSPHLIGCCCFDIVSSDYRPSETED